MKNVPAYAYSVPDVTPYGHSGNVYIFHVIHVCPEDAQRARYVTYLGDQQYMAEDLDELEETLYYLINEMADKRMADAAPRPQSAPEPQPAEPYLIWRRVRVKIVLEAEIPVAAVQGGPFRPVDGSEMDLDDCGRAVGEAYTIGLTRLADGKNVDILSGQIQAVSALTQNPPPARDRLLAISVLARRVHECDLDPQTAEIAKGIIYQEMDAILK